MDPAIIKLIAVVIAIIIIWIAASHRDPNKWYGGMVCLKCGYHWQSRRHTPPATCPSCRSKQISTKTQGSSVHAPQQAAPVTNAALQSFLSFAGFTAGDTLEKAQRILGVPTKTTDNLEHSLIAHHYWLDEDGDSSLTIYQKREEVRIAGLDVSSPLELSNVKIISHLRSIGVVDPNLSYVGQPLITIIAVFGNPTEEFSDIYRYDIYESQNARYAGQVSFTCYAHDNHICSSIGVVWSLEA
jgi:hypothetical protein